MTSPDPTETEALRQRIATLNAAILRISASLDMATVLQEAVDTACALTGACCGVIVTTDEAGQPEELVTAGLTEEERRGLLVLPYGLRLFDHLRDLSGPMRVDDLPGYLGTLGLGAGLPGWRTLLVTPMHHSDSHVGHFFLGMKSGGPVFGDEDEETLALFASQAAAAIGNARTHRAEQQTRADLEALIETTPVGVAVFDARSGQPVSFNGEARRIVDVLCAPDMSLEEMLELLTYRRADGREVSIAESPLAQEFTRAESVRAEEITLSVPGGTSVKIQINATPIHSDDGSVATVVVTMQDLAPLQETERQRVEFLDLVRHELRAPLTAIKGSATTALRASRAVDPAEARQFFRIIDEQADHMDGLLVDLLDVGRIRAGTLSVDPMPSDVWALVDRARNTFLSGGGRHNVVIDLPPDLPWVMADPQRIIQVLNNLFANAAREAPESSPIRVEAARKGVHVAVSVRDEGRGVAPERLPHLFRRPDRLLGDRRGTGIGGTGLGLAICKGLVEAHGGRIRAESAGVGRGARFTFTIPVAGEADNMVTEVVGSRVRAPRDGHDAKRILVVDDDPHTLRRVRDALAAAGYAPVVTGEPGEIPNLLRTEAPALVLLDLMLPGTDGIELMENLPELANLPVIFISAYGRDETIARALESGAADYIVKPFSPTELAARVRAALRARGESEPFVLGALAIHYDRRRVSVAGREVPMTAMEFEMLRLLSVNAGRPVTYESMLHRVWAGRDSGGPGVVRASVKKLRRKLGDDATNPAWIFTERGVGYLMPRPDGS